MEACHVFPESVPGGAESATLPTPHPSMLHMVRLNMCRDILTSFGYVQTITTLILIGAQLLNFGLYNRIDFIPA